MRDLAKVGALFARRVRRGAARRGGRMERESDSEEEGEEAAEAQAPAKRRKIKVQGAKAVPDAWRTTPSVPWPKRGQPKHKGVRYHIEDEAGNRTYWLFNGSARRPVCICQDDGLCGVQAQSTTRPGYALECALREDHLDQYKETKKSNGGVLPAFGGKRAHIGEEPAYVTHNGVECVTKKNDGAAKKLCECGKCFRHCQTFSDTHALGCLFNPAPKCDCGAVATQGEYCQSCSQARNPTALRKAAQEPALQALMAKHNIKRAPEDITKAKPKTPYAHLNKQDNWKPYIVVRVGSEERGFEWRAGCTHGLELVKCKDCFSSEKMVTKKHWCSGCFTTRLSNKKRQEIGLCEKCDAGKTKVARTEIRLREPLFRAVGFPPSAIDDTYFGTDGEVCDVAKPRKPDAPWLGPDRAVLCETDENSHMNSGYEPECCATWASDMTEALVSLYRDRGLDGDALRVFLVRWNPDARDRSRPVIRQEERARIVGERIKALREMPAEELAKFPPMVPIVIYYYYHSKAQRWIDYARASDGILVHEVIE